MALVSALVPPMYLGTQHVHPAPGHRRRAERRGRDQTQRAGKRRARGRVRSCAGFVMYGVTDHIDYFPHR